MKHPQCSGASSLLFTNTMLRDIINTFANFCCYKLSQSVKNAADVPPVFRMSNLEEGKTAWMSETI